MSFASGTFSINTAGQPVVTGTVISSTAFNALTADLATGLSTAVLKDGTQTLTANLPMAGFKLTGLGAGSATGNSARYDELYTTLTTFKVGTLTRDWSLASGNVSYTGVGFKPRAIAFIHMTNGGVSMCVGFDNITNAIFVSDNNVFSAGQWISSTSQSISAIQAPSAGQNANVASFDADGFTLAWTKINSPTGTATIGYLALR